MFSRFNVTERRDGEVSQQWLAQLEENLQRWTAFLVKLEERMNELGEAAIPELEVEFERDVDEFHRTYLRLRAGIRGQFDQIKGKADAVFEEKVINFCRQHSVALDPYNDVLFQYDQDCRRKLDEFERKYHDWLDRLEETGKEDMELKYRNILDEHEAIKDKFTCTQCGFLIPLEKIFFITTYLSCPACKTQNTFTPSTQANRLEHIGRSLAEQRCAHLLRASEQERENERKYYAEAHELRLASLHDPRGAERAVTELHRKGKEAAARSHDLYRHYLRAMFDEWSAIVPDLKEQNEKFYQRMLADFEGQISRL